MPAHWENNILLPEHRLVMALPRKAACTSLKRMLQTAVGITGRPAHEQHLKGRWREIDITDTPEGYEVIGVLREPYARLWSGFKQYHRSGSPVDFSRMLLRAEGVPDRELDPHIRPMTNYVQHPSGRLPSSWLYVEHLAEDWAALCARKGWVAPVEHKNRRAQAAPAISDLHPAAVQVMYRRWAGDFALYRWAETRREGA